MPAPQVARAHAKGRARLAKRIRRDARDLWRSVDPARISETWAQQIPRLMSVLVAGQRTVAAEADDYLSAVLDAQDIDPSAQGRVDVAGLVGVASDGRTLASLLALPGITAKVALAGGAPVERAMSAGDVLAQLITHTQVADAGRVADAVALTARPHVGGYTRMLVGETCSRCIILAGRHYRWNAGFPRHPKCDCIHIPSQESDADDFRVDPKQMFESMSPAEQDKAFTKAGAEAIRLGADINQVVNVRRGANGLTPAGARITAAEARAVRGGRQVGRAQPLDVFGRQAIVTTEGTTARGLAGVRLGARETGVKQQGARYRSARPPRLMPESILHAAAGNRDEALRLLKRFGYIR